MASSGREGRLERDEIRVGAVTTTTFLPCPGGSAARVLRARPHPTLHGVVFAIFVQGRRCTAEDSTSTHSALGFPFATRHSPRHFFTVFAGALVGTCGFFTAGLLAALSAAVLMSSISLATRAALLPRSLSK